MNYEYFCGIDGGSSSSSIALCRSDGEILGLADGPETNHWNIGFEKSVTRINDLVSKVKKQCGLDDNVQIKSLGLSLSGLDTEAVCNRMNDLVKSDKLPFVYSCNDTIGSIFTASDKGGVVLISGTGSNCRAINPDGSPLQCGGWGYMMGNEGSAQWIAFRGMKIVFDHIDRLRMSDLDIRFVKNAMFDYFNVKDLGGMLEHLYSKFSLSKASRLTKELARGAAEERDPLCIKLFYDAGYELALQLLAISDRLHKDLLHSTDGLPVICTGAVWNSWEFLRPGFIDCLTPKPGLPGRIPAINLLTLTTSAAVGAAVVAAKECNSALPIDFSKTSKSFFRHRF